MEYTPGAINAMDNKEQQNEGDASISKRTDEII